MARLHDVPISAYTVTAALKEYEDDSNTDSEVSDCQPLNQFSILGLKTEDEISGAQLSQVGLTVAAADSDAKIRQGGDSWRTVIASKIF